MHTAFKTTGIIYKTAFITIPKLTLKVSIPESSLPALIFFFGEQLSLC